MGAISISGTTPGTPQSLTSSVTATLTDDDTNNKWIIKILYNSGGLTTPSPFTVASCTTTNGSPSVTTTNSFSNVRPGDGIAISGSGFSGTTVLSVASDGKSLVASSNATAGVTATATITPPAPTGELGIFEIPYSYSSSGAANNLATIGINVVRFTGLEKTNSPTFAQGVPVSNVAFQQNISTFLSNLRQP